VSARWVGILYLVITGTGWALNWPAMRFLLREWPPLFSRGIAGVAAGLLLAIVAVRSGERLSVPREAYARLAFASFTNVFAWMGFGTLCMKWLKVGEGTLIVYSMPIWAMLLAWPILGTRPTLRGTCALVLALAGIAVLLSGQGFSFSMGELTGIGFALSASVLFALGTVLNRQPLPLPPIASTAWQVGLGCAPMIVLGLLFETVGPLSATGWWLMAYMTLFPMGVCYLTWFATLRHLPPSIAATGMLLVPLIGVVSAAFLLGEPLGWREGVAMALTLGGVTLAIARNGLRS
jgi:drug/metabolite transporter (DMT)-like permease